ncbi:uncharacterized protein LOC112340919 [Selaginella moellendorffii]|uniref:uncharacterized protein LOC112340919 n=1 Tax=Selaginella moellendorffii TaxID=88036 RepID=UPI000D1C4AE5|nr:uncharacterized protein LOC112340919 [Selaginella moellendorffii]|eukprot:XP_024515902.1 uncharacterized protein LOC112340919 [Selaginella moellendorffii]
MRYYSNLAGSDQNSQELTILCMITTAWLQPVERQLPRDGNNYKCLGAIRGTNFRVQSVAVVDYLKQIRPRFILITMEELGLDSLSTGRLMATEIKKLGKISQAISHASNLHQHIVTGLMLKD